MGPYDAGANPLGPVAYLLWLAAVTVGLGAGPATALVRARGLPPWFWAPLCLAAAALGGYVVFFATFLDPGAGRVVAVAWWIASVGWAGLLVRRRPEARAAPGPVVPRDAWLPLLLTVGVALLYVLVLVAREAGTDQRFTWTLPNDHALPYLLANYTASGSEHDPSGFLVGDWLASDRPPLQAGVVLATRPFDLAGSPSPEAYQLVATLCQAGWVAAVYALGRQLRLSARQLRYVLAGATLSGFFLLQSLYVWPKMMAGWLLVLAVALIVHLVDRRRPVTAGDVALVAGTVGLSLMAHGATAFAVACLPLLLWLLRPLPPVPLRALAAGALALGAVMAPWSAYQRFHDPPGTRLIKWHLAGVEAIDERGVVETLLEVYGDVPPARYVSGRVENLVQQVAPERRQPGEDLDDLVRRTQFFHQLLALDLLLVGFAGLVGGRGDPPVTARLRRVSAYAGVAVAVWAVLTFDPGAAYLHQASYGATILLFAGAGAGLALLSGWLRVPVMGAHGALFTWAWVLAARGEAAAGPQPVRPGMAVAGVIVAGVLAAALVLVPEGPGRAALDRRPAPGSAAPVPV